MSATATDIFFSSSSILSTNSNLHRRSITRQYSSRTKRQDRHSLPRNQVFNEAVVDSFLVSSSSNIAQSAIETPKNNSSTTKRYVSSFKTLVHSTSSKHNQRLNYVNDSVIIVKLSKENATENASSVSQVSGKQSTISMASTTPPLRQSPSSPLRFSPILKVEGQKRHTLSNDSCLTPSANTDVGAPSNSTHTMAMSATTSHPSTNPSLFAYRSTLTAGTTVRQRALAETTTTSLFITTERVKSNISSSMRPARQPLIATATAMSSAYMPSQQPQRNISQSTKSRIQQDKSTNFKDLYEYPDPFTNCPQDILSKLAQLTKLQLETVDWEKKRRFTKKKPVTNSTTHGKDSP